VLRCGRVVGVLAVDPQREEVVLTRQLGWAPTSQLARAKLWRLWPAGSIRARKPMQLRGASALRKSVLERFGSLRY
jgi:hypothetical protein